MPLSTAPGLSPAEAMLANKASGKSVPPPIQQPVQSSQPNQTGALDPQAVTLAKAIRQTESGGNFTAKGKSGEYGAYQYTDKTWQGDAAAAGINVPLQQATPEQQNQVAYTKLKSLKDQGYNVGQIASIWNSGKPDAYLDSSYKGTNSSGANYDVPAYAKSVATAYQSLKQGQQVGADPNNPSSTANAQNQNPITGDQSQPSIGGFTGNVVKSGANFLGNLADAATHPIKTIQGIGSMAAGGLQELGGQTNDNTQHFDALKNYLGQRYGSPQNLLHTAYTDPIGLAADISSVLGVGGGAIGLAGKGAEVAGLAKTAETAGSISEGLGEASRLTNPLTPAISGVSKLASAGSSTAKNLGSQFTEISPQGMQDVYDHPTSYTPEQMSNASRFNVAKDVESALQSKITSLEETGAGYSDFRQTPTPIQTTPGFLDNAFREGAGVTVEDGVISGNSSGSVRSTSDIAKLQSIYNTYKSDFLNGTMDSNKLLNLRADLAEKANFGNGLTKSLERAAAGIRDNLNKTYRDQVPGLAERDTSYGSQIEELKALRKGFIDKEGNLTQSAIAKIANAGNKDLDIQRLETLVPGITRRLTALKVMKEIEAAGGLKVGAYAKSITEAGGVVAGVSSGNLPLVAGSIAISLLTSPKIIVPLLRFLGEHKGLVPYVMAALAKYANMGAISQGVGQTAPQEGQSQLNISQSPQSGGLSELSSQSSLPASSPPSSQNDITQTPGYQEASKAGYTHAEIASFLSGQSSNTALAVAPQPKTAKPDLMKGYKSNPDGTLTVPGPFTGKPMTIDPTMGMGSIEKVTGKVAIEGADLMKDFLIHNLPKVGKNLNPDIEGEASEFVDFLKTYKGKLPLSDMSKGMEILRLQGKNVEPIFQRLTDTGSDALGQLRDVLGRFKNK